MRSPYDLPADGHVGGRGSIFDVPIALWAYAFVRSLAFLAPALAADGSIGIGILVLPVLFIFVLRRSRGAYHALVLLDVLSFVMTLAVWFNTDDNPLSIPILSGLALVALLWPSNRRYVTPASTIAIPPAPLFHPPSDRAPRGY